MDLVGISISRELDSLNLFYAAFDGLFLLNLINVNLLAILRLFGPD